jgi:DNA polymerase III epsilon subunit-like protein
MYLVFDTETTGLPKNYGAPVEDLDNWPRIVQIGWAFYDEKKKAKKIGGKIIKPDGFVIPIESSRIHGINQARAVKTGTPLKEVLEEITPLLKKTKMLIAHNIRFDIMVLGAELLRSKIKTNLFDLKRVCTMLKSTRYCAIKSAYGFKWPKLEELYTKLFGKGFEDAHDARVDVLACATCFFEMIEKGIITEE